MVLRLWHRTCPRHFCNAHDRDLEKVFLRAPQRNSERNRERERERRHTNARTHACLRVHDALPCAHPGASARASACAHVHTRTRDRCSFRFGRGPKSRLELEEVARAAQLEGCQKGKDGEQEWRLAPPVSHQQFHQDWEVCRRLLRDQSSSKEFLGLQCVFCLPSVFDEYR